PASEKPACRAPASAAPARSRPGWRPAPRRAAPPTRAGIVSSLQTLDDLAAGARAQGPEGQAVGAVDRDAPQEAGGAVGEEEGDPAGVVAAEVVQPAVGVGPDVDPVGVDLHEDRGRGVRRGPGVQLAGPRPGAGGGAGPNALRLRPGPVADHNRLGGAV